MNLQTANETLDEKYKRAITAFNDDPEASFLILLECANAGHAESQLSVAICYAKPFGTKRDYDAALDWYKAALENPELPESSRHHAISLLEDLDVEIFHDQEIKDEQTKRQLLGNTRSLLHHFSSTGQHRPERPISP